MANIDKRGFWLNAKGEAVHPDNVRVTDKIKDELVDKLLAKARQTRELLASFKIEASEEIESYFDLLLQNYDIDGRSKSKKGNITLENFSGTAKVQLAMAETLTFDEKLSVAKLKIDEYLEDITKDAVPDIRTLITKAFEVDKKGNIDAKRIFALKSYEISDPRWKKAMDIIDESKKVAHVKPYVRFYIRDSIDEPYKAIRLDIANV